MCPACIATAAWIVGSTVSTGGISALVVSTVHGRKLRRNEKKDLTINKTNPEEGERHG